MPQKDKKGKVNHLRMRKNMNKHYNNFEVKKISKHKRKTG